MASSVFVVCVAPRQAICRVCVQRSQEVLAVFPVLWLPAAPEAAAQTLPMWTECPGRDTDAAMRQDVGGGLWLAQATGLALAPEAFPMVTCFEAYRSLPTSAVSKPVKGSSRGAASAPCPLSQRLASAEGWPPGGVAWLADPGNTLPRLL